MTDINQIRRFLYNKQPGKKESLVESKVYSPDWESDMALVSNISQLMLLFKVNKIASSSPLGSSGVAQAIRAGKTLYAFIDPYAADINNSKELVVHLKAKDAEKHYDDLVGDI